MGNRTRSSRNTTDTSAATGATLAVYRFGSDAAIDPGGNSINQYSRLELYGQTPADNTHDGSQVLGRFSQRFFKMTDKMK